MKWLLRDLKLMLAFKPDYVACYTTNYYYRINGILSFAVLDLAYKIIKKQKIDYITLKKRKPIINLLNYIDALNFNSKKFDISFFLKNKYIARLVAHSLYYYRSKYFNKKDVLKVIERENSCTIRFNVSVYGDYITRLQPQNVNLVAMILHILEKEKILEMGKSNEIDVSGIMFYYVLLM